MYKTGLDVLKSNASFALVKYGSQFDCQRVFGAASLLTIAFEDPYERDIRIVAALLAALGPDYASSPNVEMHLPRKESLGGKPTNVSVIGTSSRIYKAVEEILTWAKISQSERKVVDAESLGDVACDALFAEYIYVNRDFPGMYATVPAGVVESVRRNPILSELLGFRGPLC